SARTGGPCHARTPTTKATDASASPSAWTATTTTTSVWNHFVPKLWDRTIVRLRRLVAYELGDQLAAVTRLSFVKIAELQARAAIHLHALIRLDGHDPDRPNDILPPPMVELPDGTCVLVLSAERLAELVVQAAKEVGLTTPTHPARPQGWRVEW